MIAIIQNIAEKFGMESNSYSLFHKENFLTNKKLPCYIPENADDINDIFSREDLRNEVIEWLDREDTIEYLLEIYDNVMPKIDDKFIDDWTISLFEGLTWEYPSTYLENFLM